MIKVSISNTETNENIGIVMHNDNNKKDLFSVLLLEALTNNKDSDIDFFINNSVIRSDHVELVIKNGNTNLFKKIFPLCNKASIYTHIFLNLACEYNEKEIVLEILNKCNVSKFDLEKFLINSARNDNITIVKILANELNKRY